MHLFQIDHQSDQSCILYDDVIDLWQTESKFIYDARPRYGIRNHFWDVKYFWRRERQYVAIPNMEAWERLARLAPDVPDGWSFPDGPPLHRTPQIT